MILPPSADVLIFDRMKSVDLRIACSWCSHVLHAGTPGAKTSHSICVSCKSQVLAEAAKASAVR